MTAQSGDRHGVQKPQPAHDARPAGVPASAARATANRELFDAHRKPPFQHLGIGQARVGHVAVDGVATGMVGAGPRAAADGFVILVGGVAVHEVVDRALRRGEHVQRAVQRVGHTLRHLRVAGDDRGRVGRAQDSARGNHDAQRLEAPLVQRNRVAHQGAEDVQHRGFAYRGRRVVVAGVLGRGAGEIDHGRARGPVHVDAHADPAAVVHRIGERAVAQHVQYAAHRLLGVVLHVAHVGVHHVQAEVIDHGVQFAHAGRVRGDLGAQVGQVLVGVPARVGAGFQQFAHGAFAQPPAFDEPDVVDQHAFLVDRGAVGRRRPGRAAADVGVVAARRHVEQNTRRASVLRASLEDGRHHGHVRQMRTAVVRCVQHVGVAGAHAAVRRCDDALDRLAHRPEVHRHVRRVGDQAAVRGEQGARKIQPLLDVDRRGGVGEAGAHLFGDRHEQVVEHFQQDRVGSGPGRGSGSTWPAAGE